MCSYKLVNVQFDVWALASRVESFVHKVSFNNLCHLNTGANDSYRSECLLML